MSKSQEVKIYPTDPLSDGIAFMEYDVLKSGFGDFDIERCKPRGIWKSSIAISQPLEQSTNHEGKRTTGRPGQIRIEIILIPTRRLVITPQDIRSEWMHLQARE